jgi:uncharacterized SAM-binding protein YcdF (DUF218 family)
MIYMHKILPMLFSPIMLVISLLLVGVIMKSKKISFFGIFILIFFSLPVVSNKLTHYLEIDYKPILYSEIKQADAIVVLSGMLGAIKTKNGYKYEFGGSVDRFISGINLFKNKKANFLIFTRGQVPWSVGIPEGEYLKKMAINYGVPDENIILTENVENTDQEAKAVKKLFPDKNIKLILVTSAHHMTRAINVFKAADLNVIAYPVDFKNNLKKFTLMDLIPSASSLNKSSYFIREMIGRTYYKIKYRD